jgi:hypothetical protein
MSARALMPMLSNVKYLNLNSCDSDGLDATTLIIWLLLAPNVRELDLEDLSNTAKMELAQQLNELFEIDERVRLVFDRIERVDLFRSWDKSTTATKLKLFDTSAKIFPKAVVPRS